MVCTLSYNGVLVGVNGEEYLLSDVIKTFKSTSNRSVIYDKEAGTLTIDGDNSDRFTIKLNASQKVQFEGKANDSVIKQLQKLSLDYEKDLILKEVKEQIKNGVYPIDSKTVSIYKESLNKEILKTGAKIVKDSFRAIWPLLLIGATIPIWVHPSPFGYAEWKEACQFLFTLGLVGADLTGLGVFIYRLYYRFYFGLEPEAYKDTLDSITEFKIAIKKRLDLKRHLKDVDQEIRKESFTDFVHREDEKDDAKVKEYKDRFLREFSDIIEKFGQLPEDRKAEYRVRLSEVLAEYQTRVNALLDENQGKTNLYEARNIFQVFLDLLPTLTDINYSITKELEKIGERERFNSTIQSLQQTISGETSSSSVTEELTDSGVAFQRMG